MHYLVNIRLIYSLAKCITFVNIGYLLPYFANLPRKFQISGGETYGNLYLNMSITVGIRLEGNQLTAVTLLTTPKTVVAGSKLVRGDARSNASFNFSSGTCMERKYATPRKKIDSWFVSFSISLSCLNS